MVYDIVIVGAGPAGLTAGIYAARASKSVLVLEKESIGGLISHSPKVENYPGFRQASGIELADAFFNHATDLGVAIDFDEVKKISKENDVFNLVGNYGTYYGKSIIIATGSKHRKLELEKEDLLVGHGISYCAVCDGPFSKDKDVAIIGGGNSALQEAILLSTYCSHVTIIQNLPFLTGEKKLQDIILNSDKFDVIYNKTVVKLNSLNDNLTSITLKDANDNSTIDFKITSVFVDIGQVANNEAFKDVCDLDSQGFIVSDDSCQTKTPGIFVAGDCRVKKVRQVVTATGDGSIAAVNAIRYLDTL